jgi:hypothetical protein
MPTTKLKKRESVQERLAELKKRPAYEGMTAALHIARPAIRTTSPWLVLGAGHMYHAMCNVCMHYLGSWSQSEEAGHLMVDVIEHHFKKEHMIKRIQYGLEE